MLEQQHQSRNQSHIGSSGLRALSIAALIAAGCFALTTTADARSIYRGAFDPIDISGSVDVDVPDSCLGTGSGWNFVNAATCGGAETVDVADAVVNITGLSPPVINFNGPPPSGAGGYPGVVTGLYWNGDVLQAITTSMFGPSSAPNTSYYLQFGAIPDYEDDVLRGVPTTSVDLFQYICPLHTDDTGSNECECGYVEIDPTVATRQISYARVPEPGSLALVLGALGAGWLGLRRRRA